MGRGRSKPERIPLISIIILALVCMSSAGRCTQHRPERTEDEIDLDNMITQKVRETLTTSHMVKARNISINTFKLKVTLEGTVGSQDERDNAVRLSENVEVERGGVKHKVQAVDATKLIIR